MPVLQIKIYLKDEKIQIDNLKEPYVRADLRTAVILEKGMKSGKTSIMFHLVSSTGESIIAETSAEIINGLHASIKGAEARFSDLKNKG